MFLGASIAKYPYSRNFSDELVYPSNESSQMLESSFKKLEFG